MAMESRSTKISNAGSLWRTENHPVLITIKRGISYYENPDNPHGPFFAIDPIDGLWETTFYGLEDVELFG